MLFVCLSIFYINKLIYIFIISLLASFFSFFLFYSLIHSYLSCLFVFLNVRGSGKNERLCACVYILE